jgi:hypothetical protein
LGAFWPAWPRDFGSTMRVTGVSDVANTHACVHRCVHGVFVRTDNR